jgi:hypothetical protein
LEKLVAPIALYPDPLIATILPASVYPLEIVQAARFVQDTNNLAKLDAQPWDDNVKAVARVPDAIKKLNDDLPWTMELGDAFLAQDKDVMDAIQSMRAKAQSFGTLKTSPQQVVTVTNVVVEKTVEQRVVVVTNTIVQIQPADPQVIYVPTYSPAVVYAPPPPSYAGLTFAAGVAVGAIIANNCDWHHGGCYYGGYHGNVNVNVNRNVNVNQNVNVNRSGSVNGASGARASSTGAQQKWQPDQSRLSKSGTPSSSASVASRQARGWSSGGAGPSTQPSTANRAAPSPGNAGARPSAGAASASRPAPSASASRPSPSPTVSPSSAGRASSSGSAFSGASSGAGVSSASSRGASSRFSGGGARGGGRR